MVDAAYPYALRGHVGRSVEVLGGRASLDAPFAEELCVILMINNKQPLSVIDVLIPALFLFVWRLGGREVVGAVLGFEEAERSKHGTSWLRGGPGWTRVGSLHGLSECQRCLGGRIPPPPAALFVRSVEGGGEGGGKKKKKNMA